MEVALTRVHIGTFGGDGLPPRGSI
jgi:hypothetical protein